MFRQTPCLGICSTTYGDLVCRGCKRFSHEITGWNGFSDEQRELVWSRLVALRDASVDAVVALEDPVAFDEARFGVPKDERYDTESGRVFDWLRRRPDDDIDAAGLKLNPRYVARVDGTAREVLEEIEREFLVRSQAVFEATYRTTIQ